MVTQNCLTVFALIFISMKVLCLLQFTFGNFNSFTGHSIISILPEISCKGMTTDDIPELLEKTQQLMQNEYDRLNAEICSMRQSKKSI